VLGTLPIVPLCVMAVRGTALRRALSPRAASCARRSPWGRRCGSACRCRPASRPGRRRRASRRDDVRIAGRRTILPPRIQMSWTWPSTPLAADRRRSRRRLPGIGLCPGTASRERCWNNHRRRRGRRAAGWTSALYRHFGGAAASGSASSAGGGAARPIAEQPQADRHRLAQLSRHLQNLSAGRGHRRKWVAAVQRPRAAPAVYRTKAAVRPVRPFATVEQPAQPGH
jgi:hypothetical protein